MVKKIGHILAFIFIVFLVCCIGYLWTGHQRDSSNIKSLNGIIAERDSDLAKCRASLEFIIERSRSISNGIDGAIETASKLTDRNARIVSLITGIRDAVRKLEEIERIAGSGNNKTTE